MSQSVTAFKHSSAVPPWEVRYEDLQGGMLHRPSRRLPSPTNDENHMYRTAIAATQSNNLDCEQMV